MPTRDAGGADGASTPDQLDLPVQLPLLRSKLAVPPLPEGVVHRPRLVAAIQKQHTGVVLVVAGPGYGKTVAVCEAVRELATPVAWLSLDQADDDPVRFWRYVFAAVGEVVELDETPSAMLRERVAGDDTFLVAFLRSLEGTRPLTLVLDDLQAVRSAEVLDQLAFFVARSPDGVRTIITSRADPLLPLGRWRADGRLFEVRQDELRLLPDEGAALVRRRVSTTVAEDDALELVERTEGWAVGLQLAALSIERGVDAHTLATETLASDRMLADYLLGEVLDRLPPDDRDLILDLAPLPSFDPTLAAEVTGRRDAPERLRALEARDLLLIPVDETRLTFRFHHLVRELLLRELAWRRPDALPALRRRAARAYASRGDDAAAVTQLLLVGDLDAAFGLMAAPAWDLLDKGDLPAVRAVLQQLPDDFRPQDPQLLLDHLVLLTLAGRDAAALEACEAALSERRSGPAAADTDRLRPPEGVDLELWVSRTLLLTIGGSFREALRSANACREQLAATVPSGPPLDRLAPNAARAAIHLGDIASAASWLPLIDDSTASNPTLGGIVRPSVEAELRTREGLLQDAAALARRSLATAAALDVRNPSTLEARSTLGTVLLERGEVGAAQDLWDEASEQAAELRFPLLDVLLSVLGADIVAATSGAAAAVVALDDARARLRSRPLHDLAPLLDQAEARHRIDDGDLAGAERLLARLPDDPRSTVLRASAFLRAGDPAAVVELLVARDGWLLPERLKAHLLLSASTRGDEAADHVRVAAELGVPGGWRRTFLQTGPDLLRIARRALAREPSSSLEVLVGLLGARAADAPSGSSPAALLEPLTEREQSVLELLPTHLTYGAMASQLIVSVNTVKTHTKSIFRKLDATSRSEAVAHAHAAGLIT